MCCFRKHFSTKQVLLSLIERWKNTLDQNIYGGAIPMGLSKAFDTINHDLSQTKLGASGWYWIFEVGKELFNESFAQSESRYKLVSAVGQNYF